MGLPSKVRKVIEFSVSTRAGEAAFESENKHGRKRVGKRKRISGFIRISLDGNKSLR